MENSEFAQSNLLQDYQLKFPEILPQVSNTSDILLTVLKSRNPNVTVGATFVIPLKEVSYDRL